MFIMCKVFALLFSRKAIYLSTPQVEQLQGHDLLVVSPEPFVVLKNKSVRLGPRCQEGAKRALETHALYILRETMHLGTNEPFCTLTD